MRELMMIAGALTIMGAYALLLRLMWRRMKRVRASGGKPGRLQRDEQFPSDETMGTEGMHGFGRGGYRVNDALIDQGEGARESRWPIN